MACSESCPALPGREEPPFAKRTHSSDSSDNANRVFAERTPRRTSGKLVFAERTPARPSLTCVFAERTFHRERRVDTTNLSLIVAFGAGVLSFASPCVLPLVPAYVGHLAGRTLDKEGASRAKTLSHAIAFVLGFTAVFVALGTTASAIGGAAQDVFRTPAFRLAAGSILIVMGAHMAG